MEIMFHIEKPLLFIQHNTESISPWWLFKFSEKKYPYVNIEIVLTTFKRDFFIFSTIINKCVAKLNGRNGE